MVRPFERQIAVTSFVYFARAERSKLIKIGVSKDPTQRISDIQVANGERVSLVLVVPGSFHTERKFHTRFKICRERGEWFREEGPLYKFLADKHLQWEPIKNPEQVNSVPSIKGLNGHIRGFSTSVPGKEALLNYGLMEDHVYLEGKEAETFSACLATYRGRPGWLIIPTDAREFGTNKKAISDTVSLLESKHIRILDMSNPEDQTYSGIVQRAHTYINQHRFADPRLAARRGKWGGQAKRIAEAARRSAQIADDIALRLCASAKLTWLEKSEILGMTLSTIQRHYRS